MITKQQRATLELVAKVPCRYSNEYDPESKRVHARPADALERKGLVKISLLDGQFSVQITDAGRAYLERQAS